MPEIVIIGAARTAIGTLNGTLSGVPAADLGAIALTAAMERSGVTPDEVGEVVMGHVLTAGLGMNAARQASMAAGISKDATAYAINQVCGSGLRAVANGMASILAGDNDIVLAGGQENMSLAPHAIHVRSGIKMGPGTMVDTMINDGLWDKFNDYHMGITAENVAEQWQITRQAQDEFAYASQQKAKAAVESGRFKDEIVPVTIKGRKGDIVFDTDEHPRATDLDKLAGLRPAFKKDGTVTAGNASGINDGAAALVLMARETADARGAKPLARIASWATAGVDPSVMGSGPIPASRKALERAGWTVADLDLVESNEAFAAQSCAVAKDLGLPTDIINVNGGAIALGHPIGASGARVLVTLLHEMEKRDAKKGLVTLCIGGGMGIAMCVERD